MSFLTTLSVWTIPCYILLIILWAICKKTDGYSAFAEGAKEGLNSAVTVLPFLCAMLLAIGLVRGSGLLEGAGSILGKGMELLGIPKELTMFVLIRPLSGAAALGELDTIYQTLGPDSLAARMASVMMGSTETIFYTLAVYMGAANVKKHRHALSASMISMMVGVISAVWLCRLFFS